MPNGIAADRIAFLLIVLIGLAVAIFLRTSMLKFYGFFEPDGFYHFSVIRYAVAHGFQIPKYLDISGWPSHTIVLEPHGLYWATLVPYFFLQFFGVSYYAVMRLVPVLFGLFDIIGAYYLSRFISRDKLFGLLVIFLVALSSGDAARTSALIYRGDGFVTIFVILALIFLVKVYKEKDTRSKIIFAALSGIALSFCNLVWIGGEFATAVYILSLSLILASGFIAGKKERVIDSAYILCGMVVWYILVNIYAISGFMAPGDIFTGLDFLPFIISLSLGCIASYFVIELGSQSILGDPVVRGGLVIAAFIAVMALLSVTGILYNIFVANGFVVTTSFSATIQELTPPTFNFLFASFGSTLFTTPMTLIAIASISVTHNNFERILAFAIAMLGFLPYLFMRIYDSSGFMKGNARLRLDPDVGMLAVGAYLATTLCLQMIAIRFNSLVSIPLAILSAYGVYWLISYSRSEKQSLVSMAALALLLLSVSTAIGYQSLIFFSSYIAYSAAKLYAVLTAIGFLFLVALYYFTKGGSMELYGRVALVAYIFLFFISRILFPQSLPQTLLLFFFLLAALAVLAFDFFNNSNNWHIVLIFFFIFTIMQLDFSYGASIGQADNINPLFINAMTWLKNNSPNSSVVLTLWPDGSVVEGVANRTSVTDSVGSQNLTKADLFAAWLLNQSADPQFLTSSINGRPNYLVTRFTWLSETSGIYVESGLPNSTVPGYSYAALGSVGESLQSNYTALKFGAGPNTEVIAMLQKGSINGYIQTPQGISPFSYIGFYDQDNGNFTIIRQSSYNVTNNQTLMIVYSGVHNPSLPINITGALVFRNLIANSNMFKLLYLCGPSGCAWDNGLARLQLVYVNSDTKIFKIIYNNTNG